jgi:hypothetical protein
MIATKATILQLIILSLVNPNSALVKVDALAAMAISNQVAQTTHVVLL